MILTEKIRSIKVVFTDVDGVLTDGGMYYSEGGEELKKFNVRDGVGVALLQRVGIQVGAVTGEATEMAVRRMKKIGADFIFSNVKDKWRCIENFCMETKINPEHSMFIGDEINDYALLGKIGVFMAPADANPLVRNKADFVTECKGGEGVLREAALMILEAMGKTDEVLTDYMNEHARSRRANISATEVKKWIGEKR